MSNFDVLIQQEKLFQEIQSGKLSMEFIIHNASVKGVRVFGSKKLLYNRSAQDTNDNEQALKNIVARIAEGVSRNSDEKLMFSVSLNNGKIKFVEWHSQQDKKFDNSK